MFIEFEVDKIEKKHRDSSVNQKSKGTNKRCDKIA
jgi:hypothetical protein